MTIELRGLTRKQYEIADMIWSCDSQADVDRLISNLPPGYKEDAETIHQLLIAAVFDQYTEVTEDVKALIDSCRGS